MGQIENAIRAFLFFIFNFQIATNRFRLNYASGNQTYFYQIYGRGT